MLTYTCCGKHFKELSCATDTRAVHKQPNNVTVRRVCVSVQEQQVRTVIEHIQDQSPIHMHACCGKHLKELSCATDTRAVHKQPNNVTVRRVCVSVQEQQVRTVIEHIQDQSPIHTHWGKTHHVRFR